MVKGLKSQSGERHHAQGKELRADSGGERRLLGLVETEIIPRLMHVYRDQRDSRKKAVTVREPDIETFARALLQRSSSTAAQLVDAHRSRGVPLEEIYLHLFAPAARRLGEWWESDHCSFSQVTLSLWRLQSLLHDLSPSFRSSQTAAQRASAERRILLATLPDQQHTFGLSILADFFRRDGWVALAVPAPERGEVLAALSTHWFDVLALSASMDGEADDLGKMIEAARRASKNPRLVVIVGGPLFLRQPELAAVIGADGMSADAPEAVAMATQLLHAEQGVRMN